MKIAKTCVTCGVSFMGGHTATYCPECRAERIRQHDRERHQRKLAGHIRNLGSIAYCDMCGQPYTVNAGPQKYCPTCQEIAKQQRQNESYRRQISDPAKRTLMLERSHKWAVEHQERMKVLSRQSYERRMPEITERRRQRLGYKLRPLGSLEICPKCGSEFTLSERAQRYCDKCGDPRRKPPS